MKNNKSVMMKINRIYRERCWENLKRCWRKFRERNELGEWVNEIWEGMNI
jgi:hypothetical protein